MKTTIKSVTCHISGTVQHMVMIFGILVWNDDSSRGFFQFLKILILWVVRGEKGQKTVQYDKKICLLHSISEKPYIILLSFKLNICKMRIASSVFFIFLKFWFSGSIGGARGGGIKGQKAVHNDKKFCLFLTVSQEPHIYDCDFCYKWLYLQQIFSFLKILIFGVCRG